ncbi:hypothetical protein DFQ30_005897, partial [Apophysomyces sp. BC1015]
DPPRCKGPPQTRIPAARREQDRENYTVNKNDLYAKRLYAARFERGQELAAEIQGNGYGIDTLQNNIRRRFLQLFSDMEHKVHDYKLHDRWAYVEAVMKLAKVRIQDGK